MSTEKGHRTQLTTIASYFIIRHNPTGYFMPATQRKRGYTHDEPTSSTIAAPRLFRREQDAKCALTHWLNGKYTVTSHYNDWNDEYEEDHNIDPVQARHKEEMSIISVYLVMEKES